MLEESTTPEETDASEFGILIKQVAHKEIPAYVEGAQVFLTNGIRIKNNGRIIKEVQETDDPEVIESLFMRATLSIGRNDPCYCGSGKKYKKCHLPIDQSKGVA